MEYAAAYHGFALDPTITIALAAVANSAAECAALTAVAADTSGDALSATSRVFKTGFLVSAECVSKRVIVYIAIVVGI